MVEGAREVCVEVEIRRLLVLLTKGIGKGGGC